MPLFRLVSVIDGFEWFWIESLLKNIQLTLEFLKVPILVLLYIKYFLDDVICNIALEADDTTVNCKCDQASDLRQQLELAAKHESDLRGGTVYWGRKWVIPFSARTTQRDSFDPSHNNGAIDVKMDGSVFEEKLSFKILGLSFSSRLDWSYYNTSVAQSVSKKIIALIRPMKFLSSEVALYLYESIIPPCIKYCCRVWRDALSCYLEMWDKLQKWICKIVGPSLAASLESLAHCRNLAILSFFYWYYFGRCSSELTQLVSFPYSRGRPNGYFVWSHDFSVTIPRCYINFYVISFFPSTSRLWKCLPIKCFLLTDGLNGFKSRVNDSFYL